MHEPCGITPRREAPRASEPRQQAKGKVAMNGLPLDEKWSLLRAIFRRRDVTPSAKLVLGVLLDHSDVTTWRCVVSYDMLGALAGMSRRTAIEAVKQPEAKRLVSIERNNDASGAGQRNTFA